MTPIITGVQDPALATVDTTATINMLAVFMKIFAKLSRYFNTNDTKMPHAANISTKRQVRISNPLYILDIELSALVTTVTIPKTIPKL